VGGVVTLAIRCAIERPRWRFGLTPPRPVATNPPGDASARRRPISSLYLRAVSLQLGDRGLAESKLRNKGYLVDGVLCKSPIGNELRFLRCATLEGAGAAVLVR
jgi:hypothetical protein